MFQMNNIKLKNKKYKLMDIHVQIHGKEDAITYHKLIKRKASIKRNNNLHLQKQCKTESQ